MSPPEAKTTRRAYQQAKPADAAIEILRRKAQQGWRRHDFVEAFVAMIRTKSTTPPSTSLITF
jgi:response regulator RpfG family c-di-GMP phosphodiesterase